jgi:hypothetical protein
MEGKVNLDNASYYEITDYLKTLHHNWKDNDKHWYGIVFDWKTFVLFINRGNTVVKAYVSEWKLKGSKNLFLSFINKALDSDNWTKCINIICNSLRLTIVNPDINESSFIGRGAFGRVVKVKTVSGEIKALKISFADENHFKDFEAEFEIIKHLNEKQVFNVVKLVSDSFCKVANDEVYYGGYLMEIGVSISKTDCLKNVKEVYSQLFSLHNEGISHGDPRLANLILIDSNFKWIDFRNSRITGTKKAFRDDLKILTASMFDSTTYDNADIKNICDKYFEEDVDNQILIETLINLSLNKYNC